MRTSINFCHFNRVISCSMGLRTINRATN
uniref:Uncharacterized protein n=1 Tax=Anguilla anguilla TaxID=7936 RepID=A0A0E9TX93_ANGAN